MSGAVYELKDNQRGAVDPLKSVWLSASAGTGKTQVLSARVLRLLLQPGVSPSEILCLTFTKAGAAEMAVRINDVLARWVRLKPTKLAEELRSIGADFDPDTQACARTLFASVLDCPGGGLRIDTIHAFAQWLLANFPGEAGIIPGSRPMEDRERDLLSRQALGDMLIEAERGGNMQLLDAVEEFVRRKDPDALTKWVMRCANLPGLWQGPDGFSGDLKPHVCAMLGIPADADTQWVAEALGPEVFPDEVLHAMRPTLQNWSAKGAQAALDAMADWLPLSALQRLENLETIDKAFHTQAGTPRVMKKPCDMDPDFAGYQARLSEAVGVARERKSLIDLADFLTLSMAIGRAFTQHWIAAKAREGLLDFDDLIQRAAELLREKAASDWIRFKLDRQFDHVLIDEAQDTNEPQWEIFDALIDDFFSGEGAAGDKVRTVFTVGDYKQAIFGFQGTSPENFEAAKRRVDKTLGDAAQNAAEARRNMNIQERLHDLDLGRSFRTANTVLQFVDRMIAAIGHAAFGLKDEPPMHEGEERPGLVTLWQPVRDGFDDEEAGAGDESSEGWLARHDRQMADKIAQQVARWTSGQEPFVLAKGGKERAATPGDIMVLVRSRKELAGLIVARLHAKGVPVAGVDRLRLGAPLAVKDLMAALRFVAQPLDDLSLANLLSSPLMGWSQDDILEHVPRERKKSLWRHLRDLDAPLVLQTCEKLNDILARADFQNPESLLNWILVGPWQGREKLVARLGEEANDPIDELLNAAFAFEAVKTPSITGFIQWFDTGESDLKRDPGEAPDLVRVMTVHGSKGLQAPIVILADATSEPGSPGELSLNTGDEQKVPLPTLNRNERAGIVSDVHQEAEIAALQEHWRLLYVAMTRAEEALFVGGSLSPRMRDKPPPEDSWYARIAAQMGDDEIADDIWNARREWGYRAQLSAKREDAAESDAAVLPQWALRSVGDEPSPPRPLAPSSLGCSEDANPPVLGMADDFARERGILIHALLERLPQVDASLRMERAERWLERQAKTLPASDRAEMARHAHNVLADPRFAEVFSANALPEVPITAVVSGQVVMGTIDRLLVKDDAVLVVDFKTARHPPQSLESVPATTMKQMAAYAAALRVIYPGKTIAAAVLYTQTPQLIEIPSEALSDALEL